MKIIKIVCLCALLSMIVFLKSFSQEIAKDSIKFPRSYWGSVGLGTSSSGFFSGLATINAEVADHFVISASGTGESSSLLFSTYDETNVNILGGWIFKQRHLLVTVSAGLGYAYIANFSYNFTEAYSKTDEVDKEILGFPILAQGYIVLSPGFALGAGAYVNLNSVKTTAGITFCLAFGPIRTLGKPRHLR